MARLGVLWPLGPKDLNKCYFAMKAFNLMTKYENRVAVQMAKSETNTWVLAGRNENGQTAILVSSLKRSACEIKLTVANVQIVPDKCKVRIIDAHNDLKCVDARRLSGSEVTLSKPTAQRFSWWNCCRQSGNRLRNRDPPPWRRTGLHLRVFAIFGGSPARMPVKQGGHVMNVDESAHDGDLL